jgi:hypothetical protein
MSAFTPTGGGGGLPLVTTAAGATNPAVSNVSMTLANTEYTVVIPSGVRQYMLLLRDSPAKLQVSYAAGMSGTTYITVPRYCYYAESDLLLAAPVNLYIRSPSPGQVLEVLTWV